MKLGHIEVKSNDVKASLTFWVSILGFKHESDQGIFQWVSKDGFEALLRPGSPLASSDEPESGQVQPVFYTSDLENFRTLVSASPYPLKEGRDCLFVQDPGGAWIQVVNPESHQ